MSIAVLSFLMALFINYFVSNEDEFVVNVMLSIFGSALLSAIVSLIGYFSDKNHLLKEYGFLLLDIINYLGEYQELTEKQADEKIEVLNKIYNITIYKMTSDYYEYRPFFRESIQSKFIFSAHFYLLEFSKIIKRNENSIKIFQNTDICMNNAEAAIKEIEEYMFEYDGKERKFEMLNQLEDYMEEYVGVINGNHKGKYVLLDQAYFKG